MGSFSISTSQLAEQLADPQGPVIVDVRRSDAFAQASRKLPRAQWRDHRAAEQWASELDRRSRVLVYCKHGHNVSQLAASTLRRLGFDAACLEGGYEGWAAEGRPTILKSTLPRSGDDQPTIWVTRVRPKIDRIACPWLIRRFIDDQAQFHFVEPDQVLPVAEELRGIAFDVEGAPITHAGEACSFDAVIDRVGVVDPALEAIRLIVRGADTGRFDLAPEAAGLLAVSLGLSALAGGHDHALLERGFVLYDALYAWQRKARSETHSWAPVAPSSRTQQGQ